LTRSQFRPPSRQKTRYLILEPPCVGNTSSQEQQVVISLTAAALNHRDLFIRQHLYPGTTFGVPLLADGIGIVTSTGNSAKAKSWLHKRVVLNPGSGWKDSLEGPEDPRGYAILGGTKANPAGTLQEAVLMDASELEEAPEHLSDAEAAAFPLAGLTAWRALVVKSGNAVAGRNILITGIGGGVALFALQFAVSKGCNVFVTSGSEEKLQRARQLGAKGGVNYKEAGWDKKLQAMLPKERKWVDAIVDGAGGDVVAKGAKLLKVCRSPHLICRVCATNGVSRLVV
jgi:NADPH:quinone reductase-like Zn-dependent oxidoreductase